ncbi:MAG TPA: RDD family protein [Acidimicrobiales bacterium]
MTTLAGIVTPEAVVLDFDTAGLGSRLVAEVIDLLIQFVAGILVVITTVLAAFVAPTAAAVVRYVALFLIVFGYPAATETLWRGRTVGKAALGLRVVTVEGAPVRFRHAAIRSALALVDVYLLSGLPGILSILLTARNQRLGDLAAGTIVLRQRSAVGMPVATVFSVPPPLEAYVASLDVAALTGPEYAAVRSFLLRAAQLAPADRAALAAQLAAPLAGRLGHTPPGTIAPEWYLACVGVAAQRRGAGGPAPPAGGLPHLLGGAPRPSAWDPAELGRARPAPTAPPAPPAEPVEPVGGFTPPS